MISGKLTRSLGSQHTYEAALLHTRWRLSLVTSKLFTVSHWHNVECGDRSGYARLKSVKLNWNLTNQYIAAYLNLHLHNVAFASEGQITLNNRDYVEIMEASWRNVLMQDSNVALSFPTGASTNETPKPAWKVEGQGAMASLLLLLVVVTQNPPEWGSLHFQRSSTEHSETDSHPLLGGS